MRFEFYATHTDAEQAQAEIETQLGPWLAELRESADRLAAREAHRDRLDELHKEALDWLQNNSEELSRKAKEQAEMEDAWADDLAQAVNAQETARADDEDDRGRNEHWEFVLAFNHWHDEC